MDKMTRQDLDDWILDTATRLKLEAETAQAGDLAEFVAGEVEVIDQRVGAADSDYLHERMQDLLEVLQGICAGQPE